MENRLEFDQKIENIIYEHEKRIEWFIGGIGRHCINAKSFGKIPTEWIAENYNVEIDYFRPKDQSMIKPITEQMYSCEHKNVVDIGYTLGFDGRLYDEFCENCKEKVYGRTGNRLARWNCDRNRTFRD